MNVEGTQIGNGLMYVGDCLDVMKTFPDRHVSATVTSPPYEGQRTYGIGFKLIGQSWVDWMIPRVIEMCRVTDGLVFVNAAGPVRDFKYSPSMEWLVADLTRLHGLVCGPAPYVFSRVGIPGSGGPHYHRRDWEPIYCFACPGHLPPKWSDNTAFGHEPKYPPGGQMSYRHADGARKNNEAGPKAHARWSKAVTRRKADGRRGEPDGVATKGNANGDTKNGEYYAPTLANPGNVLQLVVGGGVMGHPIAHETEAPFPLDLPSRFIAWFVPPTGRVLDPFMGSGTTAHAAVDAKREWIGIDVRESQLKLVERRLGTVTEALFA